MRSTKELNKIIQSILADPKRTYPTLSDREIKTLLIQAISRYLSGEMSLDKLATIARKILNKEQVLPHSLYTILDEMHSFYAIRLVLTDFLDELQEIKE